MRDVDALRLVLSDLNDNGESDDLSMTELRNLLEIEDLLKKTQFDKAYKLAEEFYYQADEVRDKTRFVSMLVSISKSKGDTSNCLGWCDKLIELDPNNVSYIVKKSQYIDDLKAKYSYLKDKSVTFNDNYQLLNTTASVGRDLIDNDPINTIADEETIIEYLDLSMKLNPSLMNQAWFQKINVLFSLKKNNLDKESLDGFDKRINDHVESAVNINDKNLVTFKLELKVAVADEDIGRTNNIIERLYKLYDKTSLKNQNSVNEIIDDAFQSMRSFKDKVFPKDKESFFYEKHLTDITIKSDPALLISKAKYHISSANNLEKAKSYFLTALDCNSLFVVFRDAMFINRCLDNKYNNRLKEILEKNKTKLYDRYYYEYKHELSIDSGDYSYAKQYLEKSFLAGLSYESYSISLSYFFILSEEYQKLIDYESFHREKLKDINSKAFIINFQYAAKKTENVKYEPTIIRSIIANTKEHDLLIAAHSLLEQEVDVKRFLSQEIKSSFSKYYLYERWPIINKNILNDFKKNLAA